MITEAYLKLGWDGRDRRILVTDAMKLLADLEDFFQNLATMAPCPPTPPRQRRMVMSSPRLVRDVVVFER